MTNGVDPSNKTNVSSVTGSSDAPGQWYVIKPGDTLRKLERRFGVSVAELARVNKLAGRNKIVAGKKLWIPGPSAAASAGPAQGARPVAASVRVDAALSVERDKMVAAAPTQGVVLRAGEPLVIPIDRPHATALTALPKVQLAPPKPAPTTLRSDLITRDMVSLSNIGLRVSDAHLALINASPTLKGWLRSYDAEVVKGTHLPISLGGSYTPAYAGAGGALVPGVLAISESTLSASNPGSAVRHLSHELRHFVDFPIMLGTPSQALLTAIRDDPTLSREAKEAKIMQLACDMESSAYIAEYEISEEIRAQLPNEGDYYDGYFRAKVTAALQAAFVRLGSEAVVGDLRATKAELRAAGVSELTKSYTIQEYARQEQGRRWILEILGPAGPR